MAKKSLIAKQAKTPKYKTQKYSRCNKCGRPRAGFLAGTCLATAVHFTWLARIGRIDMPATRLGRTWNPTGKLSGCCPLPVLP